MDVEGTEYLKSKEAKIKKREIRNKTKDPKSRDNYKYYKNAKDLFEDKLTAFIYVLLCEWKYKSINDQPLEYHTE